MIARDDITEAVDRVWSGFLGIPLRAVEPAGPDTAGSSDASSPEGSGGASLTGAVLWSGRARGGVFVECSVPLARRAAGVMYGVASELLSVDDVRDAVGEIANTPGGNLKALAVPAGIQSLPLVCQGADASISLRDSSTVASVEFEVDDGSLTVRLVEGETAPTLPGPADSDSRSGHRFLPWRIPFSWID